MVKSFLASVTIIPCVAFGDATESCEFLVDTSYACVQCEQPVCAKRSDAIMSDCFTLSTVVTFMDANKNGIEDSWEQEYGIYCDNAVVGLDSDADGLSDYEEYCFGSNPSIPNVWASVSAVASGHFSIDTHYSACVETVYEGIALGEICSRYFWCDTGGYLLDADGDGLPDWWQSKYILSSGDKLTNGADDYDGDGQSNYSEFVCGSDPVDKDSEFIADIRIVNGNPKILWRPAVNGVDADGNCISDGIRKYRVLGSKDMRTWDVSDVDNVSECRFFKVTVELP